MVTELARAKVNLCLHVTGVRADGMHLLDSIVVFPKVGDVLEAEAAKALTLSISGGFGAGLSTGDDNLILRAAKFLTDKGARLHLHKNLPVASGIGGGSADAAATIRALSKVWDMNLPKAKGLAKLGADVPVCLEQRPTRMMGVGEHLASLPPLPTFWIVLANAGNAVDTGAVFKTMVKRDNPDIADIPASFPSVKSLFDFLAKQRNDMEEAAVNISPSIAEVLVALTATKSCALARMSGSGGTCFGLYQSQTAAEFAAQEVQTSHPDWWVVAAEV